MYKDVICDNIQAVELDRSRVSVMNLSCYQLKLDCFKFRMSIIIPMVTIKKISLKNTQKEMRQ